MQLSVRGTARIKHSKSEVIYEIESSELDWDSSGEERQMGSEICYTAVVEHPQLGSLEWSLWEYPVGVENYRETDSGPHILLEDFTIGLEAVPEPDDWEDYDVPARPFEIFENSYHQTGDLLADIGSDNGSHVLNRMMFAHQITALESYLGDTLINAVCDSPKAMDRLIASEKTLKEMSFSLADIRSDPDIVRTAVRKYLRTILYHNLKKADSLYNYALGIKLFIGSQASLLTAIEYRHDCVHRNGFDKDGQQLYVFSKAYITSIAHEIRALVVRIEQALDPLNMEDN